MPDIFSTASTRGTKKPRFHGLGLPSRDAVPLLRTADCLCLPRRPPCFHGGFSGIIPVSIFFFQIRFSFGPHSCSTKFTKTDKNVRL